MGSTFNRLKNLRHLDLSGNRLRGHVPHGLGALTNLRDLRLSSNFLTSTLPSSLISLSNLATLLLDSNALSGSLPSLIGEMRSLVILRYGPCAVCEERALIGVCARVLDVACH